MGAAGPAVSGLPRVPLLLLFLVITLCCCLHDLRSVDAQTLPPQEDAKTLPPQEVAALKQIAAKLNIPETLWNFRVEPCRWERIGGKQFAHNLTCDCNTTANVCHVVSIKVKGQNLTGVLPEEFGNLTSLVNIELSNNYINGSIPAAAWASLPLLNISVVANRLSGPIPEEIGKIATLQSLTLDNNMLQGPLPPSLGNLTSLTRLHLSANNFTGELPETLGNLKNLTDFRIDGNDISGKIPSFIGNWTKLDRLDMQGTSLEGPFPSSFSMLGGLTELRVTDLKNSDGNATVFLSIENMPNMKHLVLRNCSLSGQIPEYMGRMANLKILDLSFNNLTGQIPRSFDNPQKELQNVYLTNNKLNGSIPPWIRISEKNLDVSYNTFADTTSAPSGCRAGNLNFVASFSSTQSNLINTCLRKGLPCNGEAKNYQFFINCGGRKVNINEREYEEDVYPQGASTYFLSDSGKWAYSSTGDFVGKNKLGYIAENTSRLTMPNPELYMSARLNPLSLKYYGLCMQNGNYTVKLHFAEIIFTNDHTFLGVGRHVFDVSIQGEKLLKDFNIAEAANGTGKAIIRNFTALVEHNTLEIHFQWAGKGTNAIPDRGFYGPLISAISVTPNFKPKLDEKLPSWDHPSKLDEKLPIGAIVGTVVASCVLVILICILVWFRLRRKNIENNELRGLQLQTGCFSFKQIKAATRNFDPSNKIGEGGFGPVYKGVLPDGSAIAVKQLSSKSRQGNREFVNEIGMISALQHPNLVKLFGCCIEGNQLLLVYEYMENNSLARALFGPDSAKLKLNWQTRCKICLDIARGLAYLHEESTLKIVHRDIKATNILLDKDLNAKISDFGLAKLDEEDNTHISTRIAGTVGYMAPEYATRGYLTDKADVYSFGVVILETVSGKSNTKYRPKEDFTYLLDWACELQEQGRLLEIVDPSLGANYSKEEAQQMLNLALDCTSPSPTLRPPMSAVVSLLEGRTPVEVPSMEHTQQASEEFGIETSEKLFSDSQTRSMSTGGSWVGSSLSMPSSKGDATFHSSTSQLLSGYTE